MKKTLRRRKLLRDDRGSALLVSLMVIVGLSLLGLGFVALSETESTIAKNQSTTLQTQAIAEAGARLVVEWFQDPKWAIANAGCPSNDPAVNPNIVNVKINRVSGGYTGKYKPKASALLFDKPYRPDEDNRFYGAESSPDVRIDHTTDQATLDRINNLLLGTADFDKASGEITEIDVYAPPMVGSTLVPSGSNSFWVGGERYGVATIKAVAQQFRNPSLTGNAKFAQDNVVASHTVRLVVGELPLPIPAGPIQGNANVAFGGNFRVHWGLETSQADLTPSLNLSAFPWANAYERPHFEHGYEPGSSIAAVIVTSGGSGYTGVPNVKIDPPNGPGGVQATATAVMNGPMVQAILIGARGKGYISVPPDWNPKVTIDPPPAGGTQATAIASIGTEHWPITPEQYQSADYFNELLGKTFADPWYGARSVGDNMIDGTTAPNTSMQCWGYDYTSDETSTGTPSYAFQWQDANSYPLKKMVTFPVIKYNYWKRIAQQGRGYKGIYYFDYKGPDQFEKFNSGTAHPMYYWVNTKDGANLGAGVYFFDTKDGSNPQLANGATNTGVLTDPEAWQSSNFGSEFLMQGFIYINAQKFGTTGQGQKASKVWANFPGEPFRDIGYPVWDPATQDWKRIGGVIQHQGAGDGKFSWQEMNGNDRFDVVVMPAPNWKSYDPNAVNGPNGNYVVKTWKPPAQATQDYGAPCTVPPANYNGANGSFTDCSEPHEPYINLLYPTTAANNVGAPTPMTVGWEDGANQNQRRPKVLDTTNTAPVTCTQTSSNDDCTSNAYDEDGAMVPLNVILDGVLYNEGDYDASGNSWYYGSILIRGTIGPGGGGANGTADVWFDEKLLKGTWAPPNMPRVIVFNEQTDEIQQ